MGGRGQGEEYYDIWVTVVMTPDPLVTIKTACFWDQKELVAHSHAKSL